VVRISNVNLLYLHQGLGVYEPLIRLASDGEKLTVVDGPENSDGYFWWNVCDEEGNEGWATIDFISGNR
jgi:hypothetical protein